MSRLVGITVAGAMLAVLAGVAALLHVAGRKVPRAAGPLDQQAYVWQRAWTPAVRESVRGHGGRFSRLVYLGAEISLAQGKATPTWSEADCRLLQSTGLPVGAALRIGAYAGPFSQDGEPAATILGAARKLLYQARQAGLEPAELQLDFDCPESGLDGYRLWVRALRRQTAPTPVVVTALPSWLDRPACRRLLEEADGFVLQVHSLVRPANPDALPPLCDPGAARAAVEKAARFGRSFRVALPTYGYLAAFSREGSFIGLSAEGPARSWPESARLVELSADAAGMADLVRGWSADRPANMTGIIWYRLPNDDDIMNWRPVTLASVMAGETPRTDLRVEVVKPEPALNEIVLVSSGTDNASLDVTVTVEWSGAALVACDAIGGFQQADAQDERLTFRGGPPARLRPGERKTIAWLRLGQDKEVRAHVASNGERK